MSKRIKWWSGDISLKGQRSKVNFTPSASSLPSPRPLFVRPFVLCLDCMSKSPVWMSQQPTISNLLCFRYQASAPPPCCQIVDSAIHFVSFSFDFVLLIKLFSSVCRSLGLDSCHCLPPATLSGPALSPLPLGPSPAGFPQPAFFLCSAQIRSQLLPPAQLPGCAALVNQEPCSTDSLFLSPAFECYDPTDTVT